MLRSIARRRKIGRKFVMLSSFVSALSTSGLKGQLRYFHRFVKCKCQKNLLRRNPSTSRMIKSVSALKVKLQAVTNRLGKYLQQNLILSLGKQQQAAKICSFDV